jgi:hypothetical protein
VIVWDSENAEAKWVSLLLAGMEPVTFSPAGEILHGDPEVIEKELVYLVETPKRGIGVAPALRVSEAGGR